MHFECKENAGPRRRSLEREKRRRKWRSDVLHERKGRVNKEIYREEQKLGKGGSRPWCGSSRLCQSLVFSARMLPPFFFFFSPFGKQEVAKGQNFLSLRVYIHTYLRSNYATCAAIQFVSLLCDAQHPSGVTAGYASYVYAAKASRVVTYVETCVHVHMQLYERTLSLRSFGSRFREFAAGFGRAPVP